MAEQIIDGTGKGFLAKVDNQNRLEVHSFTETAFETASVEGTAFNVNTLLRDVSPIGTVGSLLRITNNETFPIVLAGWFIGTDAIVMTSGVPLVSVYGNVTGFSGAESAVPLVNRSVGSAKNFNVEAFRPDSLASTLVGSAADPVLYQTQPAAGRVFGNVNITLAQGASIGVQIESSDGVGTFTSGQIYTGFQAFLAPQD
jgi:hypothetical protein